MRNILKNLKKWVLEPVLPRLGTAVSGPLIGYGVNADLSHATAAFVLAGAALAYDWIAHFVMLRMEKKKAFQEGVVHQMDRSSAWSHSL